MKRGNRCRQEKKDSNAAQNPLKNDGAKRCSTEPLHPSTLLSQPCPEGKNNRQKPNERSHQTMAMFEENTADPLRIRKRKHVPTVGGRPVGNTQAGLCACDEAAEENQKCRAAGGKQSESVEAPTLSL